MLIKSLLYDCFVIHVLVFYNINNIFSEGGRYICSDLISLKHPIPFPFWSHRERFPLKTMKKLKESLENGGKLGPFFSALNEGCGSGSGYVGSDPDPVCSLPWIRKKCGWNSIKSDPNQGFFCMAKKSFLSVHLDPGFF